MTSDVGWSQFNLRVRAAPTRWELPLRTMQTRSSTPRAVALDDRDHSGPPGQRRPRLPAGLPSPVPPRAQAPRQRPPGPCHEGWCPRSLRRSRAPRPHRSRPGCGGHHRVPRRRCARARRSGLRERTCQSPRPPFVCPTPRGHLDTAQPSSSGPAKPRAAERARPIRRGEMRLCAASGCFVPRSWRQVLSDGDGVGQGLARALHRHGGARRRRQLVPPERGGLLSRWRTGIRTMHLAEVLALTAHEPADGFRAAPGEWNDRPLHANACSVLRSWCGPPWRSISLADAAARRRA